MTRRLTTEEFVEKARNVHGGRYCYERSVYVGSQKKVTITCQEHGGFEQTPNSHLLGVGCRKCAGNHRYTTEEFVEKARGIHREKYSYDKVNYAKTNKKVVITCPEHGDFEQTPGHHLQGHGCVECGFEAVAVLNTLTIEEFLHKARLVHGDRFNYDKVNYVSAHHKVVITCSVHGNFEQIPYAHLSGAGCGKCVGNRQYTQEEFVEKARAIHGEKYDYRCALYVRTRDKVVIRCTKHGDFKQTPNRHLRGDGCPSCAPYGFSPHRKSFVYFLVDTETHSRVKIGVTNVPTQRFTQLNKRTPFTVERIYVFETPPEITLQIEKFCHFQLDSANLSGFDGATEWFKFDEDKIEALRAFIRSCGGVLR